ncbi:MAG: hypothetical protein ACTS77_01180, partial [Arsenophonus sp. NC-TX2-MAG3]
VPTITEPALITINDRWNNETMKWQEEDLSCRKMKEWIPNYTGNSHGVPKEFKMYYKGFRVENDLLKYSSHLNHSPLVIVVPKSRGLEIIERFHDDTEA